MAKNFLIANHNIGTDPCYIIAEIGSNHDRDKSRAFEMIRLAAQAGANAAKFQLFKANRIAANIDFPETRLSGPFAKFGNNVYDLYKGMELPDSWLHELNVCCKEHKVDFLVTPFDEESADKIAAIGVSAIKVSSFEITHIPLLKHIAKLHLPVLLSTGMADLGEIESAIRTICEAGEQRIALFHCGIDYPAPFESVNLRALETLRVAFDRPVGYSDHTRGITVPVAAVALGAQLYEKHVTMSVGRSPDHDFALTMDEFAQMVAGIRQCEAAMGHGIKGVQANERTYRIKGRRSIYIVEDVKRGEHFNERNLAILRPGIGLSPVRYEEIVGKRAARDIRAPALLVDGDWNSAS